MTGDKLQKAREFVTKYLPYVEEELPRFHVTGGIGWINDPNGFAPYKGEYHLFFQYYPYDIKWGPMHWGHVKTKDFITWERLPVALAPDHEYDRDGCFSGGAIELPDGRHLLIYTGVKNIRRKDGRVESFQTQCVAVGDGVNYEKYEHNPVIGTDQLPEGGSHTDFRDPYIWQEDGKYLMICGNRGKDTSGDILLYESEDAFTWKYVGILASCHNQFGKMWECPNFFSLDGQDVLLVSPMEMQAVGLEFHPGNANICLIGEFDREKMHLMREYVQAIDYGLDFYAPQTLRTEDGRRVMIAWMQNWETSSSVSRTARFMGQMTLPRELHVRDGRLYQEPVRELEKYRKTKVGYRNILVNGETSFPGISGRYIDMTVKVRQGSESALYKRFCVNVAKNGECYTMIRFKPETGTIRVDRTHSGFPHDIVSHREFPVRMIDGVLKLRIILDRYSMELFVNDGEQAFSVVLYTPLDAESISFSADGMALLDIEKYDIEIQ
ncbi:MAG: glycoside hydrolase family 32 protein [Lachnospiraceae bacterium]|nr:glycoside hydrolase family 32 protein [Lachnospiraceae bacterium]